MKFVCDRCQTRYSIADEKVRQKILRIRCKTCGNVILVHDSSAVPEGSTGGPPPHLHQLGSASGPKPAPSERVQAASGPKTPPVATAQAASALKLPPLPLGRVASGPKVPPLGPSRTTTSSPLASGAKVPPTESQKARMVPPPPPAPSAAQDPLGGRVEWFVAVAGVQNGPFSRGDAAKRIVAIDSSKVVHVWKEGMAGWKPASEVSVIAREINLLRPAALPPPPPPPAPPVDPAAPQATKVLRTPAPLSHAAHLAKQTGSTPPLFPGKPLGPAQPSTSAEKSEFQSDVDTAADMDLFSEVTTQKKTLVVESGSAAPPFTDATTKKGKNLRDLESDPLFAMSAVAGDEQETQSPPSAPVKRVTAVSVRLPLGEPPTLPNPPSLAPHGLESGPMVTFESGSHPVAASALAASSLPADGFAEVAAAMASVAPPSPTTGSVPAATVVPVVTASSMAPSTSFARRRSRLADLLAGRSGLKYLVAVAILVALVILLVVVGLRGEGGKQPELSKEQPKAEPATPEEPVALPEEPKGAATATDEQPSGGGTRGGTSKHVGPVKTRSVGPVERPVSPPPKAPGKAVHDLARPNPFGDNVKTVSQEQISGVVRSKANQAGLKSCYERALKMDNRLTSGRMDVTVSIAASGAVQRVVVNAPSNFIMVEPCIKNAVRRWTFPASSEEYGTNFPLIMQGGM